MKKVLLLMVVCCTVQFTFIPKLAAQNATNKLKQKLEPIAKSITYTNQDLFPEYVEFKQGKEIALNEFESWLKSTLELDSKMSFKLINSSKDQIGFVHYRYQQVVNNYPVENAIIMVHTQNDKVQSFNGKMYRKITATSAASLSEKDALQYALKHMNAEKYKWESAADEQQLKEMQKNSTATYYPKGELVYILRDEKNKKQQQYELTYKFDIYASKPMKRVYSYVDATTGKIIHESNRIVHGNAIGAANTMFSGTQTITTDSIAPNQFRLHDYSRGGGVITLNDNNGTNDTLATDFTDTDNFWDDTINHNNAAYDAHWATEGTYDFYFSKFNRNSIDDNGLPLYGYIHTDTAFENAFWDGSTMHYGDGNPNGSIVLPLVSTDIIGHEITHGLTQYTAGLGDGEASALNESFSDIMGTSIEHFLKPNTANYIMGEDVGAIRSMENPGLYGQPNTYLGTNWDPSMEPHQNDGVQNFWFYLLAEGRTGTNDNGDTYAVTGIGIDKATQIAFRNLTVYLTPTSGYFDAKTYAIKAAQDLFGTCSNEALQTANAWYAVGIGMMQDSTTVADFTSYDSVFCSIPATANFINASSLVDSVLWDFGDGQTSTVENPAHTYTSFGNFTVTLIAYGSCSGLADTIIKTNYISIDSNLTCATKIPHSDSTLVIGPIQTKCSGILLDNGGYGDYQPGDGAITISPTGAQNVILTFSSFNFSGTDGIYVYDGPDTTATLIGFYNFNSLPNNGTIISSGSSLTVQQVSVYPYGSGFEATWNCYQGDTTPIAFFSTTDTTFCSFEPVLFHGATAGATSWLWDFGDGNTSSLQNPPAYTYSTAGTFSVKLVVSNQHGSDSLVRINYITIDTSSNCHYTIPVNSERTLVQCNGKLYDSGGNSNYPDNTQGGIIISPTGATHVTLNFTSFNTVDSSYGEGLYIYDGTSYNDPLIGFYSGNNLPGGGTITSTGPSIYLFQYSDQVDNASGFELSWTCNDINSGIKANNNVKDNFNVFPNPANDYVQINVSSSDIKSAEIELTDLLGNRLILHKPSFSNNVIDYKLDISGLSNGLYLLKIKTNTSEHIQKIIKS